MKKTECEIRFIIQDMNEFMDHLNSIQHSVVKEYSFTDHVFKPHILHEKWITFEKIMRIRTWTRPLQQSELLFSNIKLEEVEEFVFKRSVFPKGKINLYSGDQYYILNILRELDFEPWFKIEKKIGKLIKVKEQNFSFVLEEITNLGHSVEIEVWDEDLEKIKEKFTLLIKILNLKPESANPLPLARIYHQMVIKK